MNDKTAVEQLHTWLAEGTLGLLVTLAGILAGAVASHIMGWGWEKGKTTSDIAKTIVLGWLTLAGLYSVYGIPYVIARYIDYRRYVKKSKHEQKKIDEWGGEL